MRPTFLVATTLALGALAAPAAQAAPSGTVYNVTVSGTQQFDQTDIEIADPQPAKCFDARGTTTQKTVATFTSTKPVRVKVIRSGRSYRLTTVGGPEGDHSLGIYAAKGKLKAQAILDSVASAFTLQGEEKSKYSTPQGDSTSYTKTTSARLKFMRVKG